MKPILFFLIVTFLAPAYHSASAQEFVFKYNQSEIENSYSNYNSEHPFGAQFTSLMNLLKDKYTHTEKNPISLTTSNVVDKPSIFYSVKKSNKHLIKAVKKGQMTEEEAKKELEDILVKALNIRHQNTEVMEKRLFKLKDPETIIAFYSKDVTLSI